MHPGEPCSRALLRVLREQASVLADALRACGVETDRQAAVHRARVAGKKLRALLGYCAVPPKDLMQRVSAIGRALSEARDRHVVHRTLLSLDQPVGLSAQALAEAYLALEACLPDLEADADLLVDAVGGVCTSDDPQRLLAVVKKSYKVARKRLAAARQGDAVAVHAWRKAVKRLGYQLQFVEPACGEALCGLREDVQAVGSLLGRHRDLLLAGHGQLGVPSFDEAVLLGEQLFSEAPGTWHDRLVPLLERWLEEAA